CLFLFFFFSSRRRHTRFSRDWSSDVCSSDLVDGICDYASHVVLYLILGFLLHGQIGPVAWILAVAAGMSRILQANHYEVQRRQRSEERRVGKECRSRWSP